MKECSSNDQSHAVLHRNRLFVSHNYDAMVHSASFSSFTWLDRNLISIRTILTLFVMIDLALGSFACRLRPRHRLEKEVVAVDPVLSSSLD